MKIEIKHDIVLKNGKPSAAIISYKDFQRILKYFESIQEIPIDKKKITPSELASLKKRRSDKSIPIDLFFKKLNNA